MIEYITEDNKTYKVTTIRTLIDVDALKAELKNWQEMKEPSDKELIEMGKMMHPYYMDREMRISEIERKFKEVE